MLGAKQGWLAVLAGWLCWLCWLAGCTARPPPVAQVLLPITPAHSSLNTLPHLPTPPTRGPAAQVTHALQEVEPEVAAQGASPAAH